MLGKVSGLPETISGWKKDPGTKKFWSNSVCTAESPSATAFMPSATAPLHQTR
ncbi:hypothetical protein HanRHA438_Chr06g0280871 [Helianthus annuus]|nr:hypothetical protein HanRHA438_Chr06g0280871 [Helianthus annuus]KAJ0916507.1 hypothetical protein HanPSC8_Chr06g0262451 [Helianthus annuus]